MRKKFIYFISLTVLFISSCQVKNENGVKIDNLRVEYMKEPLGMDMAIPRFSWQMNVSGEKRGYSQTAYQLVINNSNGDMVWDSKRTEDSRSINITYSGESLEPATRYHWVVNVWDQNGEMSSASSWFETGLMNPDPDLSAWDGATWIGGTDDDLVLYAPYLSVFRFQYKIQLDASLKTEKAGFIFGANDSRLMDKNMNMFQVESNKNESYIKLELDISDLKDQKNGTAKLNVYRVGYHPSDQSGEPFKSLPVPLKLINNDNKYLEHQLFADVVFGLLNVYIGEEKPANKITRREITGHNLGLNLNPVGVGNNHISFPMLAEIGFSVDAGQKAAFSELKIRNYRCPSHVLFSEDLNISGSYDGIFAEYMDDRDGGLKIGNNAYLLDGNSNGCLIVADPSRNSMPMLRTTFDLKNKKMEKARLYVTARGIYEIYMNGRRIGNDWFNPGLTQYNKTHMYQTYDVTANLQKGPNVLGAMLGEGWWSGNITYRGENWNLFGDRQSLLAKLVIQFEDGTARTVITHPDTWRYYNDGPLVYGSFFQGEVYDATRELAVEGWDTPDYDDSGWKKAVAVPLEGTAGVDEPYGIEFGLATLSGYEHGQLTGQVGDNAGIVKELTAVGVEEVRPGVFVYDMGQNMVGVPQITLDNATANQKITLRFAEVKYPDLPESGENVGMIMLENIRAAMAQDICILKEGKNSIQPRFTFHGYRFVEITGIDQALPLSAVKGKVISSVHQLASNYETSNEKVNKLWKNITWSLLGNFLSIPTDCPQRNERMGWSGDISVFARTSTYLTDASQFLNRHLLNMRDSQ
ncbi:MAG: family 78 glycoside hydrolase catalytic domain, partial [Mariniphaga sp.]|nr:family 78 glycoside hydrolase catalytic domain [Mariniphaga sp.]